MGQEPKTDTPPTKTLTREEDIAVKAPQKYNPKSNDIIPTEITIDAPEFATSSC